MQLDGVEITRSKKNVLKQKSRHPFRRVYRRLEQHRKKGLFMVI